MNEPLSRAEIAEKRHSLSILIRMFLISSAILLAISLIRPHPGYVDLTHVFAFIAFAVLLVCAANTIVWRALVHRREEFSKLRIVIIGLGLGSVSMGATAFLIFCGASALADTMF